MLPSITGCTLVGSIQVKVSLCPSLLIGNSSFTALFLSPEITFALRFSGDVMSLREINNFTTAETWSIPRKDRLLSSPPPPLSFLDVHVEEARQIDLVEEAQTALMQQNVPLENVSFWQY